jgi:hypothetical protein
MTSSPGRHRAIGPAADQRREGATSDSMFVAGGPIASKEFAQPIAFVIAQ